jgi:hypothetical protein
MELNVGMNFFDFINNNKLLGGCAMILMNIGSRYIIADLPKNLDRIFESMWMKRLIVFCIAFIATRDIKIAFFITLLFIILFNYLLHEKYENESWYMGLSSPLRVKHSS